MSSPSFPPHPCSCEADPTERAPERGRRPNNEEQNAKIPPAQQANDPMQCVHDCAYTSASHVVEHCFPEPSCSGFIEAGRWRANMEGVSDPKGYTPLVRKARITRLILMPICCRSTAAARVSSAGRPSAGAGASAAAPAASVPVGRSRLGAQEGHFTELAAIPPRILFFASHQGHGIAIEDGLHEPVRTDRCNEPQAVVGIEFE